MIKRWYTIKGCGCSLILMFIGFFIIPSQLWNNGVPFQVATIVGIIAALGGGYWGLWLYKGKQKKDEVGDNDEEDKTIDKPPKPKDDEPFGFG